MAINYSLKLSAEDVFQLLDALNSRAVSYQQTAEAMGEKLDSNDLLITEECNDAMEAAEISLHFRDIIKAIERQINCF